MFASFLALLRGNTTLMLGSGIIASILGFFTYEHLHIVHLESELATCKTISAALQNSNQDLLSALSKQDLAVAAWKQESEQKSQKAASALAIARKHAAIYEQKAAVLMESQPVANCQDLQQAIEDYYTKDQ